MDMKTQATNIDIIADTPPPKSHDDFLVDARYVAAIKNKANPKPKKQCSEFQRPDPKPQRFEKKNKW
jgi:hypothetical protein